jgi:hypothetical protein
MMLQRRAVRLQHERNLRGGFVLPRLARGVFGWVSLLKLLKGCSGPHVRQS